MFFIDGHDCLHIYTENNSYFYYAIKVCYQRYQTKKNYSCVRDHKIVFMIIITI